MADDNALIVPFKPRDYQKPLIDFMLAGGKRAFAMWHRRAGKDFTMFNLMVRMATKRVGIYYYFLPTFAQGKKIIWDGMTNEGLRFVDCIPKPFVKNMNAQEMKILLVNGSIIQVIGTDNFNCYDDKTEILTKNGWKLFEDIGEDEIVMTRTEDGLIEYHKIDEKMKYDMDGEMYKIKNNAIDAVVTDNHKFWVEGRNGSRGFKTLGEVSLSNDRIPATAQWVGESPDKFVFPVVDNMKGEPLSWDIALYCKFMGIWLAEGSKRISEKKGTYEVIITQVKPNHLDAIHKLLKDLNLNYKYTKGNFIFSNKQVCLYLKQFGLSYEKFVPNNILGYEKKDLELFLEWFIKGDGSNRKDGTRMLYSTSKYMLDQFQEIVIKCGLSGNITSRVNKTSTLKDGRVITPKRLIYTLAIRRSKWKHFGSSKKSYISKVKYAGNVYCVSVKNHVVKVRRNGKEMWCGNSIRGTNPVGCVFSEYAFQDPRAFSVVSPILRANKGWAIFNSTPNGKNAFYKLSKIAKDNPDWFYQKLTWKDTHFLTEKDIQAERDSGILPAMIEQEYNCSFEVGAVGAYYVDQIQKMREEDRISDVPHEPLKKVHVFTDIGKHDSSVFIFAQLHGKEIHIIDHYASNGKDIEDYVLMLRKKGYDYDTLWLPHDGDHKKLGMKRTVREQFKDAGFHTNFIPKGASGKQEGIQIARSRFKNVWIDQKRNEDLVLALENYQKEYDPIKKVFKDSPLHDWTSDYADAFRYMMIGLDPEKVEKSHKIKHPLFARKKIGGVRLNQDRFVKPWMKKRNVIR